MSFLLLEINSSPDFSLISIKIKILFNLIVIKSDKSVWRTANLMKEFKS